MFDWKVLGISALITTVVIAILCWRKRLGFFKTMVRILFGMYIHMLLAVTLFPVIIPFDKSWSIGNAKHSMNVIPFVKNLKSYDGNLFTLFLIAKNYIGNFICFLPLGFLIPCIFTSAQKPVRILMIGLLVSLTIEVIQLVMICSAMSFCRIVDIDDVIFNGLGAWCGFQLHRVMVKRWSSKFHCSI